MNQSTIVIVTYNSTHLLEPLLDRLAGKNVLVFDNNSRDIIAVQQYVQKLPFVKLISSRLNVGYGTAANKAFEQVTTPYALLLNPDVEIEQIDQLLSLANDLDEDWVYIAPNTGHEVTKLNSQEEPLQRITHATGCALLINLEKFRELEGFDENIFLYYEEMDLSMRALKQGFNMYYAENIYFPHNSKQSVAESESLDKIRNWHFQWSSLYYKRKHGLWANFFESVLKNLLISPCKQFFYHGEEEQRLRIKRKATIDFLRGKPAFLKSGEPYIPE